MRALLVFVAWRALAVIVACLLLSLGGCERPILSEGASWVLTILFIGALVAIDLVYWSRKGGGR